MILLAFQQKRFLILFILVRPHVKAQIQWFCFDEGHVFVNVEATVEPHSLPRSLSLCSLSPSSFSAPWGLSTGQTVKCGWCWHLYDINIHTPWAWESCQRNICFPFFTKPKQLKLRGMKRRQGVTNVPQHLLCCPLVNVCSLTDGVSIGCLLYFSSVRLFHSKIPTPPRCYTGCCDLSIKHFKSASAVTHTHTQTHTHTNTRNPPISLCVDPLWKFPWRPI